MNGWRSSSNSMALTMSAVGTGEDPTCRKYRGRSGHRQAVSVHGRTWAHVTHASAQTTHCRLPSATEGQGSPPGSLGEIIKCRLPALPPEFLILQIWGGAWIWLF